MVFGDVAQVVEHRSKDPVAPGSSFVHFSSFYLLSPISKMSNIRSLEEVHLHLCSESYEKMDTQLCSQ